MDTILAAYAAGLKNDIARRLLFTAIEDILSDAAAQIELKKTINELATLAEANHG